MGVKTPEQMRVSIDARLGSRVDVTRGRDVNRTRTLLLMERFLARVRAVMPASTVLEGGLALELRLEVSRATQDLDLRVLGDPGELGHLLGRIASWRPDPEDHVEFLISPDPHHPTITGEGVRYFGLDVAYGDPIYGEPVKVSGSDFFEKYGIPPVEIAVYPAASHLAEKLHAYTFPRGHRVNTRLKDLVDMPLLGHLLDGSTARDLRQALVTTFEFRASHSLPKELPHRQRSGSAPTIACSWRRRCPGRPSPPCIRRSPPSSIPCWWGGTVRGLSRPGDGSRDECRLKMDVRRAGLRPDLLGLTGARAETGLV